MSCDHACGFVYFWEAELLITVRHLAPLLTRAKVCHGLWSHPVSCANTTKDFFLTTKGYYVSQKAFICKTQAIYCAFSYMWEESNSYPCVNIDYRVLPQCIAGTELFRDDTHGMLVLENIALSCEYIWGKTMVTRSNCVPKFSSQSLRWSYGCVSPSGMPFFYKKWHQNSNSVYG